MGWVSGGVGGGHNSVRVCVCVCCRFALPFFLITVVSVFFFSAPRRQLFCLARLVLLLSVLLGSCP